MIIEEFRALEKNIFQNEGDVEEKIGVQISLSGHLLVIRPRCRVPNSIRVSGGIDERGDISEFSPSSAARMRRYLRTSIAEYKTFITLTYPGGHGFSAGSAKRDLSCFLKSLRRYHSITPNDCSYSSFWFMEFQSRGSIHFHIFTTHRFPKEWIAARWYSIVGSEDERHLRAGTRIEAIRGGRYGITAYAAKYASKQCQKIVPPEFGWVGRFWGVSGWRCTVSADIFVDLRSVGLRAISRQVNKLEEHLKDHILRGNVRELPEKGGGTHVYYVNHQAITAVIMSMISQIALSMSTVSYKNPSTYMFPEAWWSRDIEENCTIMENDYDEKVLLQAEQDQNAIFQSLRRIADMSGSSEGWRQYYA